MRYYQLFEGRDAALYHATGYYSAECILKENRIEDNTKQYVDDRQETIFGISLTRSWQFAHHWDDVIFELDQRLLAQNHKFIPIDAILVRGSIVGDSKNRINSEFEEFLVGSIRNLNRYVTNIYVKQPLKDSKNGRLVPSIMKYPKTTLIRR